VGYEGGGTKKNKDQTIEFGPQAGNDQTRAAIAGEEQGALRFDKHGIHEPKSLVRRAIKRVSVRGGTYARLNGGGETDRIEFHWSSLYDGSGRKRKSRGGKKETAFAGTSITFTTAAKPVGDGTKGRHIKRLQKTG